ncbi:unnamed protein product [Caenorhabditis angaria]|uniref:EF-hand domain-containing protein n=1 Tax=Caenorhabditis angaria TaxID=860376 RepID=A0A9P1IWX4_9PELO|nr:unnamed protein product [Caenorhabditis angaria]
MKVLLIFFAVFLVGNSKKQKHETAEEKLDEVISQGFKARDLDHDSILTSSEIRAYYQKHPEIMSPEGIDFIDKNFSKGKNATIDEYRQALKTWLAENETVARLLQFENSTTSHHHHNHHVHLKNQSNSTLKIEEIIPKFIKP